MPLQKQNFPIAFAQGVDTKSDPKQVVIGKLLSLENGVFQSQNRIKKRNGYQALARTVEGSSTALSTAVAAMTFKNELLQFSGTHLYSYSTSTQRWNDKGQAVSCALSVTPVVRNTYGQTVADSCLHSSGLYAFAWNDTRGGVRYCITDSTTGQAIVSDQLLSSVGSSPRCVALGSFILIFFLDNTGHRVVFKYISANAPSVLSAEVEVALNLNTTNIPYDVCVISERAFVSWNTSDGGGAIAVRYVNAFLTVSSALTVSSEVATTCLGVFGDATNSNLWVAYYNGTKIRYFIANYNLSTTLVKSATDVLTVADIVQITGIVTSVNNAKLFYQKSGSATYNALTYYITVTSTGTIGTATILLRSVGLASKPFLYGSVNYILVTYESTLQPTYFLVDETGFIILKLAANNGGGLQTSAALPQVISTGTTTFSVPYLLKDLLTTVSGTVYTQTGVQNATFDFANSNTYLRTEMANNQHIAGGILNMYDGANLVEHGFNLFPENISNAISTTTGAIGSGTRQYFVVYQWTDNQGQIHRSAPSIGLSVTNVAGSLTFTGNTTNGSTTIASVSSTSGLFVGQIITGTNIPANTTITVVGSTTLTISNAATGTAVGTTFTTTMTNKNTLTIPTLRLTAKQNARSPVQIVVFRTQDGLSVPYQISSISSPLYNDLTVDSVTYADTAPDSTIVGNPLLYTYGGVLENISAPAASLVSTYKNRVVVVPSENRSSYWYSKEVIPGAPVEFSDVQVANINQRGGDITAIFELDDKLILWKQQLIYVTAWQGPDATGSQNDVSEPSLIPTDTGTINPRSIVLTPIGIMYQSEKGIYLLDRSLKVSYIGADVEAYNSETITAAVLVANTNQIRFTTASGTALVYDYLFQQWSTFTGHAAVDAVLFEREFTYVNQFGVAMQEDDSVFTDAGAFIPLRLHTSWLSLAGLQGFQRAYHFLLLGEYKSPHQLLVKVAYDFNDSFTQENYIDATELCDFPAYGDDDTYGETDPYGGEYPQYQFRVNLERQKCQAIKVSLEDVQSTDIGEGFNISNICIRAGVKQGTNKLGSSRVV